MRHASGLVVAAFLIAACAEAEDPALEPGPPVSGRIRVASDDPRPVANARIRWILDARPARTAEAALRTAGDGKTDADGRFEMPGPTKASGGYVSFWCEEDDGWTLVSEGVLPPGEEIFGEGAELVPQAKNSFVRMLVTGGGRPLAGARLELLVGKAGAPVGDMRPAATTDARGMVEIRGLEGGAYWADISADGFAPVRMATRQFYGDADESAHDTHDLPRARTIACRLRTQDDMPPPRASVRVRYDSERGGTLWYLPANTDGRLGIVVPRGAMVELRAEAPGFAPVTEEGKDLMEVALRLARLRAPRAAPAASIPAGGCDGGVAPIPPIDARPGVGNGFRGALAAASDDTAPLAGTKVRWVHDARPARTAEFAMRRVEETDAAADGAFALPTPDAAKGVVTLWCDRGGARRLLGAGVEFAAADAAGRDRGTFRVVQQDKLVRVRVTGDDGKPVKGARVELVLDPEGAPVGGAEALTDESGTAEIRGLEASACAVDVTADGFAPSRVVVDQFPAADMTSSAPVVLSRTRTVVCRITARGGELPAGIAAFVAYENGSGGSQGGWWVPVCRDGLLRAAVPAEGPVKVLVAAPGFRTADLDASADVEEFAVDLVPQKK